MLPNFPKFKKLTIDDQEEINKYTKIFPPYSDYNFVSLFSYNTKEFIEISVLHNNLVVKFQDYITNKPFYSFIGNLDVKETVLELIQLSLGNNLPPVLKLIPEINISNNHSLLEEFNILQDPDNFDYILSVDEIKTLQGNKYGGKRNFVNRFIRTYGEKEINVLDLTDIKIQTQIEDLFLLWEKAKGQTRDETETEFIATKRLLESADFFNLIPIGIYHDEKLIAFSIDELLQNNYSIIHFEKADINYVGIFQYLKQATAKHIDQLGGTYINYEQDLGIPGLRQAKQSWNPVNYLKKYIITKKI